MSHFIASWDVICLVLCKASLTTTFLCWYKVVGKQNLVYQRTVVRLLPYQNCLAATTRFREAISPPRLASSWTLSKAGSIRRFWFAANVAPPLINC